ncbi:hypothetical protein IQ272_13250 [Chroococcidiopsidales cyanobacterium LEGE 13417]|nr:hypothetical protein [Chroococcidiopsidales cyanobacterium LEGE 13417]
MMTTQTEIQIHEFSTGIRAERTADGGWVSLGFTGQYMNATIDPIPHAVQRSIANKEFAVAEGATSDEPAIIGRVVSGSEESDWSVIAIVTRGRDEKGRSASFYRYFLYEGDKRVNNLWKILGWIENYQQLHNGEMPVFNPFDTKEIEQPNLCPSFTPPQIDLPPETENLLIDSSTPILIPPDSEYTLQVVSRLANKKVINDGNNQLVSWAYNVEALEQPGRFFIVRAASDRAYELLQKAKLSIPQATTLDVDEQAIKSAIKGLINSSRVKLEYVQAIAEPLGNTEIPESYWKEIFDGQGANNALKQGIYSPQMVRLLTLRAIVIPEALVDYLAWLEKGSKQNENSTISSEFQSQIRNYLSQISATVPNLDIRIIEGIRLLLPQLLTQKVSVDIVYQVFTTTNGLWAKFHDRVIQDIEHDLQLMSKFARSSQDLDFKLTEQSWQKIWEELKKYWQIRSCVPQEKYQAFAKLFEQLGYSKLSVIFYHIGLGKVPKNIFFQVRPNGWQCNLYGIGVEREITIPEFLWLVILKIGSIEVRVPFVIILTILSLVLGLAGGKFLLAGSSTTQPTEAVTPNNQGSTASTPSKDKPSETSEEQSIQNPKKQKAVTQFETTKRSIKTFVEKLSKDDDFQRLIREEIKTVFQKSDLSDEIFKNTSGDKTEELKWINAIYSYQKAKFNNDEAKADGIIKDNGDTIQKLKQDIVKKLKEETEK